MADGTRLKRTERPRTTIPGIPYGPEGALASTETGPDGSTGPDPAAAEAGAGAEPESRGVRATLSVLVWLAIVIVLFLVYRFMNHHGFGLTGDAPNYLVTALALTHLSPLVLWAYQHAIVHHEFYPWPVGQTATQVSADQVFNGPHGVVSAHGLGLPLLLFPFVGVAGLHGGLFAYFGIEAAGLMYLHRRASVLTGLSVRAQWVFALAMAAPAFLLAATQLYPDLISGIVLACALIELAVVERTGELGVRSAAIIAIGLVVSPWLHIQNLVGAAVIGLALVAVVIRKRLGWKVVSVVLAVTAAGWGLLAAYNEYYFAHLVGLPQPSPQLTHAGIVDTIGLIFDRHQGAFIQVPTIVIGLVGLWLARARVPVAVISTVATLATVFLLNGTYVADPFGGTVLAGRFQWTTLPILLAWMPFALIRIDRYARRMAALAVVIALAWIAQWTPVLRATHAYVNSAVPPFAPWDPQLYPGWWPAISRYLPVFNLQYRTGRASVLHLLVAVALLMGGCLAIWLLGRPSARSLRAESTQGSIRSTKVERTARINRIGVLAIVAMAAIVVIGVAVPGRLLPDGPLQWTGAQLGSPYNAATGPVASASLPLTDLGSGTYTTRVTYTLTGPGSSSATVLQFGPVGGTDPNAVTRSLSLHLPPTSTASSATLNFTSTAARFWLHFQVATGQILDISTVTLTKISTAG